MIDLMREAKARGHRMVPPAYNNNGRSTLWRSLLPVDEIFELMVDSGFVGYRKPDREIYDLTLERLAAPIRASACSSTTPTSTARRRRSFE